MKRFITLVMGAWMGVMAMPCMADASSKLPVDVADDLADREACDHFRGEVIDPPDAALKQERNANIVRYCKGTDRKLAALKRKHKGNKRTMRALNELDPHIEAVR